MSLNWAPAVCPVGPFVCPEPAYTVTLTDSPVQPHNTDEEGASQVVLLVNNPPASAGDIRDVGLIPESGRSPGGRHGNPLHYPCLENPMDRGAWQATVHRVTKSRTRLK